MALTREVKDALELVKEIATIDTVSMSPLEALTKVMELRRRAAQIVEDGRVNEMKAAFGLPIK
jgi:hypothetical protein